MKLIVMAKRPRPGAVKTRLAAVLGAEAACALAVALLQDTWDAASALGWGDAVLAGDDEDMGVPGAPVWLQGDGDLGERLERVLGRALREAPRAVVIGADTPGLPVALLEAAREAASEAVLGPSDDGGFYLLGLTRCPPGLLADLPWSASDTFARTRARLLERGLPVTTLAPWFDVDEPADLARLARELAAGRVVAPRTREVLRRLGLPA